MTNQNFKIIVKGKHGDKSVVINAKKEKTPTFKHQSIFKGRASSSLATDNNLVVTEVNETSNNGVSLTVPSLTKDMIGGKNLINSQTSNVSEVSSGVTYKQPVAIITTNNAN